MKFRVSIGIALCLVGILGWKATAGNRSSFGDPFSNLPSGQIDAFNEGKEEFEEEEAAEDGLGPVFNDLSCAACHFSPAIGGDSDITETRFGTTVRKKRGRRLFDPMEYLGGSLVQSQGIGKVNEACDLPGEVVPQEATIRTLRKTTSLFGLGLVDNVPDRTFIDLAQSQRRRSPGTAGRPNMVEEVTSGRLRVGKFGWKSQNPTLLQFSGDAYLNEMGITSPAFPEENCPQGNCALLDSCDLAPDPEDDGAGVQAFANFMTFLAPPPRGPITQQVRDGERVFDKIGCADCHVSTLRTGRHQVAALDRVTFHPYSDFLLHDMGKLGDGIEQGQASGREMRTAPLWGLRKRHTFLHDASVDTIANAILAHDGQGQRARDTFKGLNSRDHRDLLAFLDSL